MSEPWYSEQHSGHQEFERRFRNQHEGIGPELRAALRVLKALVWWRKEQGE